MKERIMFTIRRIIYLVCLVSPILLVSLDMYKLAAIFGIFMYLTSGFVFISFILLQLNCKKIGTLLINLTFPYTLFRVPRAYYYWLKASIESARGHNDISLKYALKVNVKKLTTVNNRSIFYSFIASLYYLNKCKDEALEHIEKAIELPHKEMLDEHYQKLYSEIKGKEDVS